MAEHILFAHTINVPEDVRMVEAVVKILLKDEGSGFPGFTESCNYIAAMHSALAEDSVQQIITHNNIRLLIQPSRSKVSAGRTVMISRVYPNLKPAVQHTNLNSRTIWVTSSATVAEI